MKLIAAILFILCVVLVMPSMVMAVLASATATRKERWQLRGMIAVTILILTALFYTAVHAAESVQPTLEVTKLTVEMTWAESEAEIRTARARLGNRAIVGPIRGRELGFSVLVRVDGEYVCRIVALKPENVDDRRTLTLGHEIAHCLLGGYHR